MKLRIIFSILLSLLTSNAQSTEMKKTITVRKGDTLQTVSVRAFGSSKLWKEIYQENSDILPNPNAIEVNTELKIPQLSEEYINRRISGQTSFVAKFDMVAPTIVSVTQESPIIHVADKNFTAEITTQENLKQYKELEFPE